MLRGQWRRWSHRSISTNGLGSHSTSIVGKTDPRPVGRSCHSCAKAVPRWRKRLRWTQVWDRHPVGIAFLVLLCQWKLKKNPQEAHDPSQFFYKYRGFKQFFSPSTVSFKLLLAHCETLVSLLLFLILTIFGSILGSPHSNCLKLIRKILCQKPPPQLPRCSWTSKCSHLARPRPDISADRSGSNLWSLL